MIWYRFMLFALTSLPLSMVAAQSMDLNQAYQLALEQDPVLAAGKATLTLNQEKIPQGKSGILPRVNAKGNIDYAYQLDDSESLSNYGASINLSHPLYRKSNQIAFAQSKLFVSQAETQFELVKQELALRVAEAYFAVLSAQESVGVAVSQKAAFAESLDRANLSYRIGTATITDKLEAQARFDLADATEIAEKSALDVAKQSLKSIIGVIPGELFSLREDIALPALTHQDINYWVSEANTKSPEIQLSLLGLDVTNKTLESARSAKLPTVDLVASAAQSHSENALFKNDSSSLSVGIQLDMPIYTGGFTSSKIREAIAAKEEQQHRLEENRRKITLNTQQAYLAVTNGQLRVGALKKALTSSQSVLDATKKGLEVGVRTNLDVLDAQQQYFSTKQDLMLAKYNYLLDTLRLKAAIGQLGNDQITQVNELLVKQQSNE